MYYVSILMVGNCRQAYASLSVGRCSESVLGQTYRLLAMFIALSVDVGPTFGLNLSRSISDPIMTCTIGLCMSARFMVAQMLGGLNIIVVPHILPCIAVCDSSVPGNLACTAVTWVQSPEQLG